MSSENQTLAEKKEYFGYKKVASGQKAEMVQGVFSSVANNYDLMNDLMSAGMHRIWKRRILQEIRAFEGASLLDVAGGTGDIAFRFFEKSSKAGLKANITVCDRNPQMLEEGKKRAIDKGILGDSLKWQEEDAQNLNFPDNSFDYLTIAFGIRNVTDRSKAFKEFLRVLKPGGKFICLEFSHVEPEILAKFYDFYSFNIIPALGNLITGNKEAYKYLVESIRLFPDKKQLEQEISSAGFKRVSYESLSFGVVAMHKGWKI